MWVVFSHKNGIFNATIDSHISHNLCLKTGVGISWKTSMTASYNAYFNEKNYLCFCDMRPRFLDFL